MPAPIFRFPIREPVLNYKTQEVLYLTSFDKTLEADQQLLKQIVEICNQPQVYRILFQQHLNGKPYALTNAQYFAAQAQAGWENNQRFVFLVMSVNHQVAGAIDIRSNDLNSAEIGGWFSTDFSGVVTNSLMKLIEIAKAAGYKKLYAWVDHDNERPIGVLQRTGFTALDSLGIDQPIIRYEKILA